MRPFWNSALLRGSVYKNNPDKKWVDIISAYRDVFDRIDIRPPQIIVGLSVTHGSEHRSFPQGVWAFPAILDTGFNRTMEIDIRQLERWTSLRKENLTPVPLRGDRQPNDRYTDYFANIWIHRLPYVNPRSDQYGEPLPLRNTNIIRVMAALDEKPFPRLPLLGLESLVNNDLDLRVDGRSGSFAIHRR